MDITKFFPFLLTKVSSHLEILASTNIKVKSTQNCCRFLHYVGNSSEIYFRIEENIPLTRITKLFLHSHQLSTLQVGQSSNCDTYYTVFFHAILSICSYGCYVHTVFWAKKIFHLDNNEVLPFLVIQVPLHMEILTPGNIRVKSTQNHG